MIRFFRKLFFKKTYKDIDPDEIFLDSKNLPNFDVHQFEGRMEKPISMRVIGILAGFFVIILGVFSVKLWNLQIVEGKEYVEKSANNRLRHSIIFSQRGVIFDRNEVKLAWNSIETEEGEFAPRRYTDMSGFAHVLGYVRNPAKDKAGFYFRKNYEGVDGVEKLFNDRLNGTHGTKIVETNVSGKIQSESVVEPPQDGENMKLSIDSRIQNVLYEKIEELAERAGFSGGAGGIMDLNTGEMIALVSYPEYSPNVLSKGSDALQIQRYFQDSRTPFLNRFVSGLFTPGSIVKPFLALGALYENLISPEKQILSTGSIALVNEYDRTKKSVFTDWKAHGYVDMRRAIAVSSNVYFYVIGGGFENQKGLGITNVEKYMRAFGFGENLEDGFFAGPNGTIPNPNWKEKVFDDIWRIGDTYNTSIGQYGVQVTPMQALRAVAAVANDGKLVEPTILKTDIPAPAEPLPLPSDKDKFNVLKEGMRKTVTEGTGTALNVPYVQIASKTGTAEVGPRNMYVNSWVIGYFPYENPQYAFTVLMDRGPRANLYGSSYIMREVLDWMSVYAPEYFEQDQ